MQSVVTEWEPEMGSACFRHSGEMCLRGRGLDPNSSLTGKGGESGGASGSRAEAGWGTGQE